MLVSNARPKTPHEGNKPLRTYSIQHTSERGSPDSPSCSKHPPCQTNAPLHCRSTDSPGNGFSLRALLKGAGPTQTVAEVDLSLQHLMDSLRNLVRIPFHDVPAGPGLEGLFDVGLLIMPR